MSDLSALNISASGNDWLGIGQALEGVSAGTADCGSKPVCLFGSDCKKRKDQYNQCIQKSLDIKSQEAAARTAEASSITQIEESMRKIYIGLGITLAVIVVALIYFNRKKYE